MGRVALVLRVMPESLNVDLERVKEEIKEKVEINDIGEEAIAFGLKAVKVSLVIDDKEGVMDKVEQEISDIDGVSSVEVEKMTLI